MALPIGTLLDGKFKIIQILGEGGMGTVYKVEQVGKPGYFRAVKELIINPNMTDEERKSAIERFDKEIDLLFNLKHPRIPSLILSFQERGNYYFVMEFVPGRTLEQILENAKAPLDEEQVIKWMMQVCEALSYIHSQSPPIILRDLKPGNVMITPDNNVQLIDFGIARKFDPNKRTNTENLGTISYASPEHLGSITAPGQRRSAQNPGKLVQTDARSDIYSLGATMYHLLTNREPDPIQTPAVGSIYQKNPRLRTVQINGRLICPVEQVIIKAMQQEPEKRFQRAEAMRVALQQCLPNNAAPTTIQIPAMSPNATIIVPAPAHGLVCPKCGLRNRPGAKFCKRDGQPLTQGATTVPPQMNNVGARSVAQSTASAARAPIRARPIQRPVQGTAGNPAVTNYMAAYNLGIQYFSNKNYLAAINQFKLAKTLQSASQPSYDALYNLGRAYRQYALSQKEKDKKLFTENMTSAIEQLEQAIKVNPNSFDAYFQLGMCFHELEMYTQASAAFKAAQQISPRDAAVYYQLGLVALDQGYNLEAEAHFLDGLKITPDHILILLALGRLYISRDQAKAAITVLRQATQYQPTFWEAWYQLGRAHMKAREWNLALSALEQARLYKPDASEIYNAMASCYLKTRKKAEAKQMVRESLQRNPNNPEANRLLKQM